MKTIASTFSAVLIASAAFASAANASEGEYYEGAANRPAGTVDVDRSTTGSINSKSQVREPTSRDNRGFTHSSGDYYEGVR